MKIFQVLNHFLPFQTAGTEVYAYSLSRGLQGNGESVSVVIPNYQKSKSEEYNYNGLRVHKYAEPTDVDRSLIMGFRKPEGLSSFVSFLNEQKPDIVHFHELAGSNGITLHHVKAAKEAGAKVFFTFHLSGHSCKTGNMLYKEKKSCDGLLNVYKCTQCYLYSKSSEFVSLALSPVSYFLYSMGIDTSGWNNTIGTALSTSNLIEKLEKDFHELINFSDKLIVLTDWYKKVLLLNGVPNNKIEFIPQALPFNEYKIDLNISSVPNKPIKLMFLGRISHFKGLHILVEAVQKFKASDIELYIYGKGDGTDYQENLMKQTAHCTNIHWCGELKSEEVCVNMQYFDALCLCSTFSEMSPLVIQEAFASGLPVIASNVHGNAEQIRNEENGLLFDFKNVKSLTKQLRRIKDNPGFLLQLKSNIVSPYLFKSVVERHSLLYKKICSVC